MAGLTTSANFIAGQLVGFNELNAIISGASLTHDCIDGLTSVGFDATGQYLTSVGSTTLRKVSGQQIIDGVGSAVTLITNRTQKTPLIAADSALIYDSVAAQMKSAVISDFSLAAATRDASMGSLFATAGTPGAGPVIAPAWNLANLVTGNVLTTGTITLKAGLRLAFLVQITLVGVAGATTDPDIAIIRDDFGIVYAQLGAIRFNTTVGQKVIYTFMGFDNATIVGPRTYLVKMQQTAGTVNTIFDIRFMALGFN